MNFLTSLLTPIGLRILAGLALAAAILFAFLRIRHQGRMIERAEAYQRAARHAARRRRIETVIEGEPDDVLNNDLRAPKQRGRNGK